MYSPNSQFIIPYHLTRANGKWFGYSVSNFIHDYGAPKNLKFDGSAFQVVTITPLQDNLRRSEICHHVSSPRNPNENPNKVAIQKINNRWHQIMLKK